MLNKIYYGDNLEVLRRYIKDESVDLCYIDPPFNSKRNYNQIYNNIGNADKAQAQAFTDTWTWDDMANQGLAEIYSNYNGAFTVQSIDLIAGLEKVLKKGSLLAYLISMTLRIAEIHRVLKSNGSFYLHCDPTASHYLKLVLDAIFCTRGGDFKNEIIWRRNLGHHLANGFDNLTDSIFYYTKSNIFVFNSCYSILTTEELNKKFPYIEKETGRRFNHQKLEKSTNAYNKTEIRIIQNKVVTTDLGWVWTQQTFDQRLAQNPYLIYWTETGRPRYKLYADEYMGTKISNLWFDIMPIASIAKERLGYPTQKPEALLERIITASSNEGDIVLDAYCGCGTTVAVAERLQRQWIGIDITYQSISLILKRLTEQSSTSLANIEINGVPKDFASAVALANKQDDRTRKEFEKWLVLTYSRNQAIINDKKGGDGGIDGIAFIAHNRESENKKILFSVKSNKILTSAVIRELNGTVERENAAGGILLTLYPMPNLVKESKLYGNYHNELVNRDFPKIQVVSVEDIFNGKLIDFPHITEVLKATEMQSFSEQHKLI